MRKLTEAELAALARLLRIPEEQRTVEALQKGANTPPAIRPSLPIEKIIRR